MVTISSWRHASLRDQIRPQPGTPCLAERKGALDYRIARDTQRLDPVSRPQGGNAPLVFPSLAERFIDPTVDRQETGVSDVVIPFSPSCSTAMAGSPGLGAFPLMVGSPFAGLRQFNAASLPVFHLNDYPAIPPRETITSAHRVFPGDGVAPLETMVRDLRAIGFAGVFSLELFNPEYWQRDALEVARMGLEKMRSVVES